MAAILKISSRDCSRKHITQLHTKFHRNAMIRDWDGDIAIFKVEAVRQFWLFLILHLVMWFVFICDSAFTIQITH